MTIELNKLGAGGGSFISKFASKTIEVSSGATGTYITLTPPSGQRVKLTALSSSGVTQTNLTTITVGANVVVSDALMGQNGANPPDVDEFLIGFGFYNQVPILGDIDEVIEISTNVATSQGTFYTYQFGE